MKKLIIENGAVVGVSTGDIDGVAIPLHLVNVPIERLSFVDGVVVEIPPVMTKDKLISLVNSELHRRWRGGFPVLIGGVTKWFHSDEFSLAQHLGLKDKARDLLAAGGAMTDNITISGQPVEWSTMDGTKATITAQVAFDLVAAAGVQQGLIFAASKAHRLAVAATPDPASYDVLSGWPPMFGDPV